MSNNNHRQTATLPAEFEVVEGEMTPLSSGEIDFSDLEVYTGEFSETQEAQVEKGAEHTLAQRIVLFKHKLAIDNSYALNEYMSEEFVNLMIRQDYRESRIEGRPCEKYARDFIDKRRKRMVTFSDKAEERHVMQQLNIAGKSVEVKVKCTTSGPNIFRMFTSEKTIIQQPKEQDSGLEMMKGPFFGTEIE